MRLLVPALCFGLLASGDALACPAAVSEVTIFEGVPVDRPDGFEILSGRLQTRGRRVEAVRRQYTDRAYGAALIGLLQRPGQPWRDATPVFGYLDKAGRCYGRTTDLRPFHNRPVVFVGRRLPEGSGLPDRFQASYRWRSGGQSGWTFINPLERP